MATGRINTQIVPKVPIGQTGILQATHPRTDGTSAAV